MLSIKSHYEIEDESALLAALYERPRSIDALLAAVKPLRVAFGNTKNLIEIDEDGDIQVCVQWPGGMADGSARMDSFIEAWWLDFEPREHLMFFYLKLIGGSLQ